ncbi:dihydrofolate reductase family protein [Thermomonospora catenispora]|uniref:dihydrofolate reductase family protein n=1 Tax=Thermomonospora catenispora TaxID=2493090 RepID=UPI00111F25BA|nr:dihydrofolate reductase family protein [Thermomonospora catenispora]TNY37712.1 dihydrofolate reductase [Thermomonospora catenispora]
MPKLRAHNISVSLDGYMAGPRQGLEHPLGVDGERLHDWVFRTRTGKAMVGESGGAEGLDDDFVKEGETGVGATIIGRNMYGPIRGPWDPENEWRGWWGDNPPFHHPVFVLTHHPHPSITMEGGTTFHFVTEGIEVALQRAFEAADGADVRLGGGASTIQQYLRAGLLDELHMAIVPVLLGAGERLFDRLDGGPEGYECTEFVVSSAVVHVRLTRARA